MDDRRIHIAEGNRAVIAENGPMRLVIQAYDGERAELQLAREAAQYGFSCLADVAADRTLLCRPHGTITSPPTRCSGQAMLAAVRNVGDADLTPMAAVAGTIADQVADWLFSKGLSKIIVDNGGDIAIRTLPGQEVTVGLRPTVSSPQISHLVRLQPSHRSWGINTSGLGGRSFTRGIASAVTAFGGCSSVADAAATAVANCCLVDDPAIIQAPANSIDPTTDLGELPVTVQVGNLSDEACLAALKAGLAKGQELVERGLISGAFLVVGAHFAITENFDTAVGILRDYI